jgi:hypothetical protein
MDRIQKNPRAHEMSVWHLRALLDPRVAGTIQLGGAHGLTTGLPGKPSKCTAKCTGREDVSCSGPDCTAEDDLGCAGIASDGTPTELKLCKQSPPVPQPGPSVPSPLGLAGGGRRVPSVCQANCGGACHAGKGETCFAWDGIGCATAQGGKVKFVQTCLQGPPIA